MNEYEKPMQLAVELTTLLAGITYAKPPADNSFSEHFEITNQSQKIANDLIARRDAESIRLAGLIYWCDGCETEKEGTPTSIIHKPKRSCYCADCHEPDRVGESSSDRRERLGREIGDIKHDQRMEDGE
jgi:hypothetical protein